MDNIIKMYETSFRRNWDKEAVTDYFSKETVRYSALAANIAKYHILFSEAGIAKGDKIALIGKNDSQWVTIYISVITYGAVIVPILPTFNPADAVHIVNHSDARILFSDVKLWQAMESCGSRFEKLDGILSIDGNLPLGECGSTLAAAAECCGAIFDARYRHGFSREDVNYTIPAADDVIIISYTSGTSGFSKGVMLSAGSITSNVKFAIDHKFHFEGSRVLGLLPLAHAYGCAFDMLTPLSTGSHITLLSKSPTPTILISAMKEVRPHLICTVPLVLEKIVKKNIFPVIEKQPMKALLKIPVIRFFILRKIRNRMLDSFGGCCIEVNTGGAALSPDVESFLMKIKFPFTVGYGMTECGPLVSYTEHKSYKAGSCGKLLPCLEGRVIQSENGEKAGEICVRGINVMKGYYNNPEATAQAIDEEGWLHTGDVGTIEEDGTVYLKGRCKSMILTSDGQNIYPETIEAKLNPMPYVMESLVYEEKGKLIALIVPDILQAEKDGYKKSEITGIMDSNIEKLNSLVAPYEKVAQYKLCEDEFEKTPKRSIRRYLYPKNAKLLVL